MLSIVGSLFGSAGKLVGFGVPCDDDFVDRLNHNWTTFLLTLFALAVTTKQFAGHPIRCAIGKQYDQGGWSDYIHNVCWIKNTYDVPFPYTLPVEEKEREMREVKYYQWVPIILLLQALLFKLPNMVWKLLNGSVGLNIEKITTLAQSTQYETPEKRNNSITNISQYIHSWLIFERERHYGITSRIRRRMSRLSILFFPLGYRNGTYLVGLYCFSKLLYFINAVGQFFLLTELLKFDFKNYGVDILTALSENGEIVESPSFPKVTYCDVKFRQLQNIHTFTVQCVLSINMISERLFAFLWFWILLVCVCNGMQTARWGYNVIFRRNRRRYVEKYLNGFVNVHGEQELCQIFVDKYLRDDGVLVLRAVASNSSTMVLEDIVHELWELFLKHRQATKERREKERCGHDQTDTMETVVSSDVHGNTLTHLRKSAAANL